MVSEWSQRVGAEVDAGGVLPLAQRRRLAAAPVHLLPVENFILQSSCPDFEAFYCPGAWAARARGWAVR
jgi:hypothetical protein